MISLVGLIVLALVLIMGAAFVSYQMREVNDDYTQEFINYFEDDIPVEPWHGGPNG